MVLAVIVAIVGVTAAWFGNQYTYNGAVEVSSANPENNAIIVPDSESDLPTGDQAILTPAKIKAGLILSDGLGSFDYDLIGKDDVLAKKEDGTPQNPYLDEVAIPVTVTFDFVYNGAPANPDGVTSKMQIELVSVTLQNPLQEIDMDGDGDIDEADREAFQATLVNYRDEFALTMNVTTSDSSVMMFTDGEGNTYYTQKSVTVDGVTNTYYELNAGNYIEDNDEHKITFNMIPVTHTLNATIYFVHVDEMTPPELVNAQLFLNFKVTFLTA